MIPKLLKVATDRLFRQYTKFLALEHGYSLSPTPQQSIEGPKINPHMFKPGAWEQSEGFPTLDAAVSIFRDMDVSAMASRAEQVATEYYLS